MTQVTTFSNDYINVTVWREDSGNYSVQTSRWPKGNRNAEDNEGGLSMPETNKFRTFTSKESAMRYAENEYM